MKKPSETEKEAVISKAFDVDAWMAEEVKKKAWRSVFQWRDEDQVSYLLDFNGYMQGRVALHPEGHWQCVNANEWYCGTSQSRDGAKACYAASIAAAWYMVGLRMRVLEDGGQFPAKFTAERA